MFIGKKYLTNIMHDYFTFIAKSYKKGERYK